MGCLLFRVCTAFSGKDISWGIFHSALSIFTAMALWGTVPLQRRFERPKARCTIVSSAHADILLLVHTIFLQPPQQPFHIQTLVSITCSNNAASCFDQLESCRSSPSPLIVVLVVAAWPTHTHTQQRKRRFTDPSSHTATTHATTQKLYLAR